jgi:carbon starvation protein
MTPLIAALLCFAAYGIAYRLYARHLATRLFELAPGRETPAHKLRDDVDYMPTNRFVLFGHHYASITGLSPMLGPAIAVIWGWVPAMLWVVLGAIFVGAVHDFSALAVSIRARGMSIGKVAEGLVGKRAKSLFHVIIFFLIALAMGVFVDVVATLFSGDFYPESVLPTGALMVIAITMGILVYRFNWSLTRVTAGGFVLMLTFVWLGIGMPIVGPSPGQWKWLLLGYAFAASVLPVWMLLQPRDYINSLLLYLGLGGMYVGLFVSNPDFVAPAFEMSPEGAPPIYPFVFIVIACGAASGFHSLVSSGTTAKQLNSESDAVFVGYGGMIGESLLGLMAVLACTAGFISREDWLGHYATWDSAQGLGNNIGAFITGTSYFLGGLGVPTAVGSTFIAVVVVSFALTTLDSATRLLRYNIAEISETVRVPALGNRYLASLLACGAIGMFAFYEVNGQAAGLVLWQLFGTTNQLMAGLALLAVTLYLLQRGKPIVYTAVPMFFMLVSTMVAMVEKLGDFWNTRDWLLLVTGGVLFAIAVWLSLEAVAAVRRYRREPVVTTLEVEFKS